jgi:hypothetical protein
MPAHSRSKNGVASIGYVVAIHVLQRRSKDVDGRNKSGHDDSIESLAQVHDPHLSPLQNLPHPAGGRDDALADFER